MTRKRWLQAGAIAVVFGIAAWVAASVLERVVSPPAVPTSGLKWIAASSLVFWFGAICAGRLIAYLP